MTKLVLLAVLSFVPTFATADNKQDTDALMKSACAMEQAEFEASIARSNKCTNTNGIEDAVRNIKRRRLTNELVFFMNNTGWSTQVPKALDAMAPFFDNQEDLFLAANLYVLFNPTKYKIDTSLSVNHRYGEPGYGYRLARLTNAALACSELPVYQPTESCKKFVGR